MRHTHSRQPPYIPSQGHTHTLTHLCLVLLPRPSSFLPSPRPLVLCRMLSLTQAEDGSIRASITGVRAPVIVTYVFLRNMDWNVCVS